MREIWRSPRVIGRRIEGRMVLVAVPTLDTRVLNELGARIWELADGRGIHQIAASLAAEFDVPESRVRDDAAEFVATLAADGFLVVR